MFTKFFAKKPERPFIKLCVKCGGKGQLSFYNQFQEKTYGPCDHCSNGHLPMALGISLKCRCQESSVSYIWVAASEARRFKRGLDKEDIRELVATQGQLGAGGIAVLLLCDDCGARYICQDGVGRRRKISGDKELNDADKEFNRHIANTMVSHGILKELTTTSEGVVMIVHRTPSVDHDQYESQPPQPQRPASAMPGSRTPTQPFAGSRLGPGRRARPSSAPAPGMRQEPLFQHVGLAAQQAEADAANDADPAMAMLAPPQGLAPLNIPQIPQSGSEQPPPAIGIPVLTPRDRLRPRVSAHTPVTPVHVL